MLQPVVAFLLTLAQDIPPAAASPEPLAAIGTSMESLRGDAFGDTPRTGPFEVRTLTQVRFGQTFGLGYGDAFDSAANPDAERTGASATVRNSDGWQINRMFLRLISSPSKHVESRVLVDFAELMRKNAKRTLKLAYVELRPYKWLELTAGLFKRRFSLLELLPIADFEFADVGPTDDFMKDLGYGGRDVGGMVRLAPLDKKKHLSLYAGAFAGDAEEGYDTSIGKLLTFRVESTPFPFLRFGVDLARRTSPSLGHEKFVSYEEIAVLEKGTAYSGDVTFALLGLELRAEAMYGDRTDSLWRGDAKKFLATWAIASYRLPIGRYIFMPALRAEWLDADADRSTGGRMSGTVALNFLFSDAVRLEVDIARHQVQNGSQALHDRPWPTDPTGQPKQSVRTLDVARTSLIVQLQVKI